MERRIAAILAADVVGYSRLVGEDEEGTLRMLGACREVIDALVTEHSGRVFGSAGDSVIAEFASPVEAVRCAVEFQRVLGKRNADLPDGCRMEFRVGINVGDVVAEGDNLLGDGVNVAARLESLANPGSICLSGTAYDYVVGKVDAVLTDSGEHQVKNIARPVKVWRWSLEGSPEETIAQADKKLLPLPDKPSIAVLPFDNISGDPEQEYFADGITEDIIISMSKASNLFVITRNSVFTYKGNPVKVQDVGRDLGVRYVLEGSVRKAGGRVRITAQLADAKNGRQLWAERFDRDLDDIFALQDELSLKIVSSASVRLSDQDGHRLRQRGTTDIDAYDHLLRGRDQLGRHTPEANAVALDHFARAVKIDPNYAAAYVHLAETHLQQMQLGWCSDPTQLLAVALDFAKRGSCH